MMRRFYYYCHGSRAENKIALTFDDGPNPYFTSLIVEVLNKYRVKGTFFLIGKWSKKHPEIVKLLKKYGHAIGNHSYSHSGDFDAADKLFRRMFNIKARYIRFPFTFTNPNVNNEKWALDSKICNGRSSFIVDYDVGSGDWKGLNAAEMLEKILAEVKPGSIIDFHDGSENQGDWEKRPRELLILLPHLINELQSLGYQLVSLEELKLVKKTRLIKTTND